MTTSGTNLSGWGWDELMSDIPAPSLTKAWAINGDPDQETLRQLSVCLEPHAAVAGALMADSHVGYSMPIGAVIAYDGNISPSGVGFDIACGNKAVLTDADPAWVRDNISTIMDDVERVVRPGIGQTNPEAPDHLLFGDDRWRIGPAPGLFDKARMQLGTIGSGNHYVNIMEDRKHRIWIGCHFGSRGFGHAVATHYLEAAGGQDGMHVAPALIPDDTDLGREYIALMRLAGEYAYAGRDWVCSRVAQILGASVVSEVHNHHNFAWVEEVGGRQCWVVRKGATPAYPGQQGFVGATMAEPSVIVEGTATSSAMIQSMMQDNLFSTVHGAGRAMGRNEAAGKWKYSKEKGHHVQVKAGKISEEEWMAAVDKAEVELRGGGLDEAPQAYKRLPDVLEAQGPTIDIVGDLRPIGVVMAGRGR